MIFFAFVLQAEHTHTQTRNGFDFDVNAYFKLMCLDSTNMKRNIQIMSCFSFFFFFICSKLQLESTHGKKLYHHHYRALLKTAGFLPTPINECVINLPICNASYIIYSLVSHSKFHVYELSGNYFNKIYCWTNHIYRYNFEGADNERTKVDRSIIYFIFYSTIERWNWLWKREYSETLI